MRTISVIVLAVCFITRAYAQDVPEPVMPVSSITGLITYEEVVQQDGTKDELFNRCSSWLHTFYANPWEATKVRDQATGLIRIQHQFRIYDQDENGNKTDAGMILYSMKIEFKENRYRYTVDNFILKQLTKYPIENWLDKSRQDYSEQSMNYLAQINAFVQDELVKSLKEEMKPEEVIEEAEW